MALRWFSRSFTFSAASMARRRRAFSANSPADAWRAVRWAASSPRRPKRFASIRAPARSSFSRWATVSRMDASRALWASSLWARTGSTSPARVSVGRVEGLG